MSRVLSLLRSTWYVSRSRSLLLLNRSLSRFLLTPLSIPQVCRGANTPAYTRICASGSIPQAFPEAQIREKIVEKYIEVPVEKIVERIIEVPIYKGNSFYKL